jgi:hypothetical protein
MTLIDLIDDGFQAMPVRMLNQHLERGEGHTICVLTLFPGPMLDDVDDGREPRLCSSPSIFHTSAHELCVWAGRNVETDVGLKPSDAN